MIFIDTNVFMYAVGRPHTLKQPSRAFFIEAHRSRKPGQTQSRGTRVNRSGEGPVRDVGRGL